MMKKLFLLICICWLPYIGYAADIATDFVFYFIYPDNGAGLNADGSSVSFTFVNKTRGCSLNNASMDVDHNGMFTGCTGATFVNNCGTPPFVGDDIEFTATVLNGEHTGKVMTWSGIIKLAPDGTSDVTVQLEFEEVKPKISVTGTILCAGESGKTVTATITDGPADMTGYSIDWGNSNITTAAGSLTSAGATGNISTSLTTTASGIKATLKKNGTDVATSAEYTVTVNQKPTVTITPSPASVCSGSGMTLTANPLPAPTTGYTYTWKSGSTTVGTAATLATGNLSADKTYTLSVKKGGCDSDEVTQTVTVKPLPTLTKVTADKTDVCSGVGTEVTLTAVGGSPAGVTYEWGGGATGVASTAKVTPTAPTNIYTVKAVKDGCKSAEQTVTVNVHSVTVALSASPTPVSYGGTTTVTATPTCTPAGGTATMYTWTKGAINGATSGATLNSVTSTALTANTDFEAEVTDNFGCKGKGSLTVPISGSALVVAPTGGGTFCQKGMPTTLNAGDSGGSGTPTYAWSSVPAGLIFSDATAQAPQVLGTSAPGTYVVTVVVTKGAETKPGTVNVTVKQSPTLGAISATPSSMTTGNASQLAVTSVNPNTATVTWSGTPLATNSGLSVSTGVINTAGTYSYKATVDLAGCKDEKSVSVTVTGGASNPDIVITPPTGPIAGNINTPINGNVTVSGGDGNYTYEWSSGNPDVTITDNGDGSFTVTSPTPGNKNICVKITSGGKEKTECFDVIVTDPAMVNLVMTVDKKCAYVGEQLTITIVGTGADTYSFILRDQSNNAVLTVTNQATWAPYRVPAAAAGTYKITDFKYKIGGVETVGMAPAPVTAMFDPIPNVYATADHSTVINHCEGSLLTLKASGDAGVSYSWDHGVADGIPFPPTTPGTYTVTATNLVTGCKNSSSVNVTINPKPIVVAPLPQEVCAGTLVTLTATGTGADLFTWNNGVINGQPFRANMTTEYEVTGTNTTTGCSAKGSVIVTVNQPPHIVRTSKNPRNIAIGKDVYFALTATGKNLTYQWKKKESGAWINMVDNTASTPVIIGAHTDSLSLLSVPKTWDGAEFRCVVTGDCGKDSTDFLLGVRECFAISTQLAMWEGIIPDEDPGNKIDGWYCRGQKIALKAIITSEEGYVVENARYKWTIDGLDIPEEHLELISDTAILTWIPAYTEDDIVVKVCAYSDGACEEVCPRYLRLKAREFDDVAMRILTDRDPSHMFCPGDTVNFWIASKNAGVKPQYTWYNDVFKLPEEQSPKNKLLHYENEKVRLIMGQEDTWMRVVMTPSPEVCLRQPVLVDTLFMRKKQWVTPSLSIFCPDTLVCKGDSVSMKAIYANAGSNPTFQWQRSIGDPIRDWNLGTKPYATVFVDEEDVWVKCMMKPSEEVCYDMTKPMVSAVKIAVMQADGQVTITANMKDKRAGDELVFESEVKNILGTHRYEWVVNERIDMSNEEDFVSTTLKQGDIVYTMVSGERVCQTRVKSNEIVVDYGQMNRDTMLVIYKGEIIRNLDMAKPEDQLGKIIFKIDVTAMYGMATINPNGKFTYIPNSGFVGTDEVKYVIVNKSDKTVIAEGYIYISVVETDRFFVPNLITPNGDGLNDTWKLNFLSEFPNHLIQVYDRNGKIVYETRNYQNDWNGEGLSTSGYVGHINLVNGVYTYVIDLGDKDKTILKSWIEIRANLNRRNYR